MYFTNPNFNIIDNIIERMLIFYLVGKKHVLQKRKNEMWPRQIRCHTFPKRSFWGLCDFRKVRFQPTTTFAWVSGRFSSPHSIGVCQR